MLDFLESYKPGKPKRKELVNELVDRIQNLKVPKNLPATVEDAHAMQELFISRLGVFAKNSIVMASQEDQEMLLNDDILKLQRKIAEE